MSAPKKPLNRTLVGLACMTLVAIAVESNASAIKLTDIILPEVSGELQPHYDLAKIRQRLEMGDVKHAVDYYGDDIAEMFGTSVGKQYKHNSLLATVATGNKRDSTSIKTWSACHTACHSACHGSRGWR
ncbi:MAG: hypothetical protein V3T17_09195 [Pseudomonadales bacterium]